MGWSNWFKDSSGGEVKEKVEKHSDGAKDTHFLRTEDRVGRGDKENHSHSMIREKLDGTKSGHSFHGHKK